MVTLTLQLFMFMLFIVVYDMLGSSESTYEGFNMCGCSWLANMRQTTCLKDEVLKFQ
jgi:hypothetical protein